jgi:hypothetical protein
MDGQHIQARPAAAENGVMNVAGDMVDVRLPAPDIKNVPEKIEGAERVRHLIQLAFYTLFGFPVKIAAYGRKNTLDAMIARYPLPHEILDLHWHEWFLWHE